MANTDKMVEAAARAFLKPLGIKEWRNYQEHARAALEAADRAAWSDDFASVRDGKEVLLFGTRANIPRSQVVGHFTKGGGDEQPPYGPDWFYWNGYFFQTCSKPLSWRPLPTPPDSP